MSRSVIAGFRFRIRAPLVRESPPKGLLKRISRGLPAEFGAEEFKDGWLQRFFQVKFENFVTAEQ